jgi:hypothetical protein
MRATRAIRAILPTLTLTLALVGLAAAGTQGAPAMYSP